MAEKFALITGGSRGIGKAIAFRLAREGYRCILTARNEERLQEVAAAIEKSGAPAPITIPADLMDANSIATLAEKALAASSKQIDVLVNNAGVLYLKPFLELSLQELDEMLTVNFRAVFQLTQLILPAMIQRQQGTIVNIASLAGKNGFKTGTGYGATKWALRGWASSLMLEVREHNIRVVTIFPGSVNTDMAGHSPTAPLRETMIQPEDVAEAVWTAVQIPARTMLSEIDIRPTNPKKA